MEFRKVVDFVGVFSTLGRLLAKNAGTALYSIGGLMNLFSPTNPNAIKELVFDFEENINEIKDLTKLYQHAGTKCKVLDS